MVRGENCGRTPRAVRRGYAEDFRVTTLADKIAPYAAQFRRDGFVMVPDLLRADVLDDYGAAVDEAVARRKRFDNRKLGEKTPYEQSFIQCINLWGTRHRFGR